MHCLRGDKSQKRRVPRERGEGDNLREDREVKEGMAGTRRLLVELKENQRGKANPLEREKP